jgi:hypothetical protein
MNQRRSIALVAHDNHSTLGVGRAATAPEPAAADPKAVALNPARG